MNYFEEVYEKMLKEKIKISEIFCSIQGEGIYTGTPSIFIRFQGCSSRCAWCDTSYGQNEDSGKEMTIQEILDKVSEYLHVCHIVITGGEPLENIEGLKMLLYCLCKQGSYFITVETNGTINPFVYALNSRRVNLWSISPKLQSAKAKRHYNFYAIAAMLLYKGQLKFVVSNENDIGEMFVLLSEFTKIPPIVIVQPNGQDKGKTCTPEEYSKRADWLIDILLNKYTALIEKYDIRIMLQTHKVIWGNTRGI